MGEMDSQAKGQEWREFLSGWQNRSCAKGYSREVTRESEEKAALAKIRYQNDGKVAKLKVRVSRTGRSTYRNRDAVVRT